MNTSITSGLTALVCLVIITVSCRKQNDHSLPNPNPHPEVMQLKRIEQDPDNYLGLEYSNNTIAKANFVEYGQPVDFSFTYDANKKPAEAIFWDICKMKFVYKNGRLDSIQTVEINLPSIVQHYVRFSYADREVIHTSYMRGQDTLYTPTIKSAYRYDANGSIISRSDSVTAGYPLHFVPEKRMEFEYDAKKNPFAGAGEILYALFENTPYHYALYLNPTPHNITRWTVYDKNNQLQETRSYQFEYNTNNLPVKAVETTTAPGKSTTTKNIVYTY